MKGGHLRARIRPKYRHFDIWVKHQALQRQPSLSILSILPIPPIVHSRSRSVARKFHIVFSQTAQMLRRLFICTRWVPLDSYWVVTSRILRSLEPQFEFQIRRSYHHFYLELGEIIPPSLPTVFVSHLKLAFFNCPQIRLDYAKLLRTGLYPSVLYACTRV